jgi:hypothetical protein
MANPVEQRKVPRVALTEFNIAGTAMLQARGFSKEQTVLRMIWIYPV